MLKFVEYLVFVAVPAGCAVLLAIGVILYYTGRLGLGLRLIAPARRGDAPKR